MDQEVRLWDSECMQVVDKYKNETAILDSHWGIPSGSGIIAIALGSSCIRLIDPRSYLYFSAEYRKKANFFVNFVSKFIF
jgi:hypothetical protein